MDKFVARMNIAHFRKRLAEERDSRILETIRLLPRRASVLDTTSRIGCHAPEQAG